MNHAPRDQVYTQAPWPLAQITPQRVGVCFARWLRVALKRRARALVLYLVFSLGPRGPWQRHDIGRGAALRHPDCGSLWHPQQNRQYGNLPDSDLGIFMASSSPSQSSMSLPSTDVATTRDSCVPLFSGQPNDCRERRKRIALYHNKMVAPKREKEAVCGGGLQPPWLSPAPPGKLWNSWRTPRSRPMTPSRRF